MRIARIVALAVIAVLAADASVLLSTLLDRARAQESVPNVEHCMLLTDSGVRNTCNEPISLQFYNGRNTLQLQLDPGEDSSSFDPSAFDVAAACPAGYVSSVPLRRENLDALGNSEYSCVRQ